MDALVEIAYAAADYGIQLRSIVEAFLLHKYPYTREIALVCNSINGSLVAYAAIGADKTYWLHSLVTVALSAYGGGFLAPILIGKPALPFCNDLLLFTVLLAWYAVFYMHMHKLLSSSPVKAVWLVFVGLFRTHAVTNMVIAANNTLTAGPYYPIPLFGPIICGALLGSLGMFLPFTKGLTPISKGAPWNLQAAYYTAYFYHTMIHDTNGFVGRTMRLILGTYTREQVLVIIATAQILHLEMQLFLSPDVNLFAPLHKVCYLLFQVHGPVLPPQVSLSTADTPTNAKSHVGWAMSSRRRLSMLMNVARVLLVIAAVLGHIYWAVPPVCLHAMPLSSSTQWAHRQPGYEAAGGEPYTMLVNRQQHQELELHSMSVGHSLGVCHYLTLLPAAFGPLVSRHCTPYVVMFEAYPCPAAAGDQRCLSQEITGSSSCIEYALVEHKDMAVNKFFLPHSLKQHPVHSVYPLYHSAEGQWKVDEVKLALLSDGQLVLWMAVKQGDQVQLSYAFGDRRMIGRVPEGSGKIQKLTIHPDSGELVMRAGGSQPNVSDGSAATEL